MAKWKHLDPPPPPRNLRELIHEICKRPTMFTGSHDFELAATYIEGYMHACADFNPEALGAATGRSFDKWLALKLNRPRNIGWSYNLWQAYPVNEIAFEKLPSLFEEFLNSGEWCEWDIYIAQAKRTER